MTDKQRVYDKVEPIISIMTKRFSRYQVGDPIHYMAHQFAYFRIRNIVRGYI